MTYEQVYKMINGLQKKAADKSEQQEAINVRRASQTSEPINNDKVGQNHFDRPNKYDLDENATPINRYGEDRLAALLASASNDFYKPFDLGPKTQLKWRDPAFITKKFIPGTDRYNNALKYLYQRRKQNIHNAKDPRNPVKVSPVPEYFKDPVDRRWLEQAGNVAKNKGLSRKSMVS